MSCNISLRSCLQFKLDCGCSAVQQLAAGPLRNSVPWWQTTLLNANASTSAATECSRWWPQGCVVMALYSYRHPTPIPSINHVYFSRGRELWKDIVVNCYLHAAKVKDSWLHSNISHKPECGHRVYISAHVQHNKSDLYTPIHFIKPNQTTHWSHYYCSNLD